MISPELGVGTAQFGALRDARGRARPGEDEVRQILETAADNGLTLVDTAARYGEAERLLGQCWPFPSPFRVVTKTLRLSEGLDRIEARARRSLERMGLPRGYALLVDAAEDLLHPEGRALWGRLEKLREEGVFQKIGFSADGSDEPMLLARRFRPDMVQLPCSLLDQRAWRSGVLAGLKDLDVEIQLRSVFVQGLLFHTPPPASGPARPHPAPLHSVVGNPLAVGPGGGIGPRLSRIRRHLAEAGADPMLAALAFALSRPEASAVIVGVGSCAELRALVAASLAPAPSLDWDAMALDGHELAAAGLISSAA